MVRLESGPKPWRVWGVTLCLKTRPVVSMRRTKALASVEISWVFLFSARVFSRFSTLKVIAAAIKIPIKKIIHMSNI